MGYEQQPGSNKRLVGLGVAVLSHAFLIYAFTSLAPQIAGGIKRRVEVAIIAENRPPPPPPKKKKKTEESKPKPKARPKPRKAWQPKAEIKTSGSTSSGTAITQTTEDLEEALGKPKVVAKAPPKKKKKKRRVKKRPRLLPGCRLPRYPSRSEEKGEEGTTVLRFLVGTDGSVKSSKLVRSSGFSRLDDAAKKAFSRCKFKPGTVNGAPVQSWVTQPFTWRLR